MTFRQFKDQYAITILNVLLILIFLATLTYLDWEQGFMHSGGWSTLVGIFEGLLHPDLSPDILQKAFIATLETFAYALISISLAIVLGFILAIFASGILFQASWVAILFRGILGFLRAIHELVWAWIFVMAIGLNPLAAIFALAIPYAGALGKVYADSFLQVDQGQINALKETGANPMQLLCYGYIPSAFASILSYTLYRLECAIRSSSVLSFVGVGGIGFEISLTLQDLAYDRFWVFVTFLILLVWVVDYWGKRIREANQHRVQQRKFIQSSAWTILILISLSWYYIMTYRSQSITEIFQQENAVFIGRFFERLMGVNEKVPAFFNADMWQKAVTLSWETLVMSTLAIGIATIVCLITVFPAAKNIAEGQYMRKHSRVMMLIHYIIRFFYLIARSIPELLWATVLVFIFKPGILPGALALAIHNIGILGKLTAEVIEDLDSRPLQNLATNGASQSQLTLYGIIPMFYKKFINYVVYRWEIIIRTSIIVGFVGAGGLGQAFKLAMSFLRYSEIALYILCYILLVYLSDIISAMIKRWIDA